MCVHHGRCSARAGQMPSFCQPEQQLVASAFCFSLCICLGGEPGAKVQKDRRWVLTVLTQRGMKWVCPTVLQWDKVLDSVEREAKKDIALVRASSLTRHQVAGQDLAQHEFLPGGSAGHAFPLVPLHLRRRRGRQLSNA